MMTAASLPLIEEGAVPDIFISGIGRIERLTGSMVRITYFKEQRNERGEMEHIVTLKIVRAIDTWPQAIRMVAMALGNTDQPVIVEDGLAMPAH